MRLRFKVFGLILLFVLLYSFNAAASSPFSELTSTDEWTSVAIRELGRSREIPGFHVPEEPNRNQAALLVARLLEYLSGEDRLESRRFGVSRSVYLDDIIFTYNQRVEPEKTFTAQEVEVLYRLVLEFKTELEVLGYAIQDFNLLYAQAKAQELGGLFTGRSLLYSEQALAAARRQEEESKVLKAAPEEPSLEVAAAPQEPRSLWTGQFSSSAFLPPSSSFSVQGQSEDERTAFQIGGLEVSGALRPGGVLGSSSEAGGVEGAGYGLSVKMGDVSLQTAVDLAVDPQLVPREASTSVDLRWDWSDLFTLSAGYKMRERLKADSSEGEGAPLVTSLGVTVPITRGQVHLGMTQEWNFTEQGGLSPVNGESISAKNTAELGLSYELFNDSSLRLNYRLIDFSNLEQDFGAEAEAAFSIKF